MTISCAWLCYDCVCSATAQPTNERCGDKTAVHAEKHVHVHQWPDQGADFQLYPCKTAKVHNGLSVSYEGTEKWKEHDWGAAGRTRDLIAEPELVSLFVACLRLLPTQVHKLAMHDAPLERHSQLHSSRGSAAWLSAACQPGPTSCPAACSLDARNSEGATCTGGVTWMLHA